MDYDVSSAGGQLRNFTQGLASATGMLSLVLFFMIVMLTIIVPWFRWAVLCGILWATTLSFTTDYQKFGILVEPLQSMRMQGRGITAAGLVALIIPAIGGLGQRKRVVIMAAAIFFLFEFIFSMRLMWAGLFDRGFFGFVLFILNFVAIAFGVSRWLQTERDVHTLVRTMAMAGALFVMANLLQVAINSTPVARGNRFYGTTGNPQGAGLAIATFLPAMLYIIMRKEERKLTRVFTGFVAGAAVVLLMWTGSRTGVLLASLGAVLFFRRRIGRLLVMILLVGLFAGIAIQFMGQSMEGLKHITSTEDTRSHVWAELIEDFKASPMVGVVTDEVNMKENSYLSVAARFGVLGLVPLGISLLFLGAALLRMFLRRRELNADERVMGDLVIAGIGGLLFGAMFEGFLAGTLSLQVFSLFMYMGMLGFILDPARRAVAATTTPDPQAWLPDESAALAYERGYQSATSW